jgi:hypothetical protein
VDFAAAEGLLLAPPIPPAVTAHPVTRVDCDDRRPSLGHDRSGGPLRRRSARRRSRCKGRPRGRRGFQHSDELIVRIALVGLIAMSIIGAANAAAREPLIQGLTIWARCRE